VRAVALAAPAYRGGHGRGRGHCDRMCGGCRGGRCQ